MSPDTDRPSAEQIRHDLSGANMRASRRVRNRIATVAMFLAFLVAAVPLVVMGANVLVQGIGVVTDVDWWTQPIPGDVGRADLADNEQLNDLGFGSGGSDGSADQADTSVVLGMQPAIVGTFLTVFGASVMAVPLGHPRRHLPPRVRQERPPRPAHPVHDRRDDRRAVDRHGPVHLLHLGRCASGPRASRPSPASLALACLMLPIVIRSTEEMLRLVPDELREASAALGTRTWKTTVTVVLPAALPGITSGALLAVARAAGETAPVVFTIGFVTTTNWSLPGPEHHAVGPDLSQLPERRRPGHPAGPGAPPSP